MTPSLAAKPKTTRRKKGDPPRSHFEAVRDELGWSSRFVAQQVGSTPAIVDRWAISGDAPQAIMVWMDGLVAYRRRFPPPAGWKTRTGKTAK